MKTLVTLCFMALLGLVLVEGGRRPCGCRPMFNFCTNDYKTYHSICEYKCKHPSTPFQDWYILYFEPCRDQPTEETTEMEIMITSTNQPVKSIKSNKVIPGYVWEPSTGSRYKVHTAAETWRSAKATCEAEGGHLAIINSRAESILLMNLFNKYTVKMITGTEDKFKFDASMGFRKLMDDGRWQTIHGQSLAEAGFDEWYSGKPSKTEGIENCGALFWNGQLNEVSCDTQRYPFICEA